MRATVLDLRRKTRELLMALRRGERVTIFYRGKECAVLVPSAGGGASRERAREHESFGMWSNHEDLEDVASFVRTLRQGRRHDP